MKNAISKCGLLLLTAGLWAGSAQGQTVEAGRVVRVVDGDTYDVLAGGAVRRVRLLGVDAPEHDQAFGAQATDSVRQLLWPERRVWLTRQGLDLYGRMLATVRLPVASGPALALDSLLVVRGWAWAWDPTRRLAARAAQQAAAIAGGRGLWKCGAGEALLPSQWRKMTYRIKRRYGVGCTW
ncbi:thermonuclease family protein [Hymenobacter baengnokdamensis]|uniref:thermonuclease family protein n=1 Tax=Hymenobacter baengnokdamensis TaxID=2615203 RepID=UPI001248066B|nr:thermonuclease family protein [Hymenobacter baengnokdamensis]